MDSCVDNAKTIMECRRSLNEMVKHYKITFIWIPGHQDIEGNCIADELASKGTTIEIFQEKDTIGMLLTTCRLFIKQGTLRQAEQKWKNATNCEISKQTWPCRTKPLLGLRKSDVKTLTEVLTEHCLKGIHVERMGRNSYDYWRSCQQPEEEENIEHLLCHCPAYNRTRNELLGNYFLSNDIAIFWLLI